MYTIGAGITMDMMDISIRFVFQWILIKGLKWTYPNYRALKESWIFIFHH